MTPLALAAALALSAAAQAPAGYPSEDELKAQAHKYTLAVCDEQAASVCLEAGAIFGAYKELLTESQACESSPKCDEDKIGALASRMWDLDTRAAALPRPKGRVMHDLFRLSSLISARLNAAAARTESPGAALGGHDTDSAAPKAVEQACLEAPKECGLLRASYEEGLRLRAEIAPCVSGACDFKTLHALARRAHVATLDSIKSVPGATTYTLSVFSFVNACEDTVVGLLAVFVDKAIAALTKDADAFDEKVTAAANSSSTGADQLPGEGATLLERYQEASIAADHLALLLGYDKVKLKRDVVNAQTTRLSALRARANAVLSARAIAKGMEAGITHGVGGVSSLPGTKAKLDFKPKNPVPWTPTLLDRRSIPPPGSNGGEPKQHAQVVKEHGQTTTIGSPGLYEGLAYQQAAPDTCGIAVQVQVLRAHGLLPLSVKPSVQEKELAAEALKLGNFNEGVAPELAGEMLIAKGLLVSKRNDADFSELEAAIRRGGTLIIGVDARELWGIPGSQPLSHAVLLTGAELDARTDELVGVYINDSGDDPAVGGRFITVDLLKTIWKKHFAEIK